jgi:ubiquinone biosynthesis protein
MDNIREGNTSVSSRVRVAIIEPRPELDLPGSRRLDPDLEPTPLLPHPALPPVVIEPYQKASERRGRTVLRTLSGPLWRLVRMTKTGRGDWAALAKDLRPRLEMLGGAWIKVGQLMSLRGDLFPDEFCSALSQLQNRAKAFPPEIARQVIEAELGAPCSELFDTFDDLPVAAASLSQVHRAVIRGSNTVVAIKVQRPDMAEVVEADMRVVERLVLFLERHRIMTQMRWIDAFVELREIMREEVDFRYELNNARRLRRSLRRHKVYVPHVFRELSTRRVLTMEFLHGVVMTDYMEMRRHDPVGLRGWLRENYIDPELVGRRLFKTTMRQLLEDNLFHADMHPGNIMLLRDSRLALIDMGSIGSLDFEFLQIYKNSLRAMANADYGQAVDLNLRMSPEMPAVDLNTLRSRLVRVFAQWAHRSQLDNIPYREKSLNSAATECGRILNEYKVPPSWTFMRVSRTWYTLDTSLSELIPNVSYVRLFRSYFADAQNRMRNIRRQFENLRSTVGNLAANINSIIVMSAPALRRRSLNYPIGLDRIGRFSASFFTLFSRLFFLAGLYFALVWDFRFGGVYAGWLHFRVMRDVLGDGPNYADPEWYPIIVGFAWSLSLWAHRVAGTFSRIDVPR